MTRPLAKSRQTQFCKLLKIRNDIASSSEAMCPDGRDRTGEELRSCFSVDFVRLSAFLESRVINNFRGSSSKEANGSRRL